MYGYCLASFGKIEGREYILVTAGAPDDGTGSPHIQDARLIYNRLGEAALLLEQWSADTISFIVEGNTVRIVNSAIYAMQVLQKEMEGEAERAALTSDEDVMALVKELRNEDDSESTEETQIRDANDRDSSKQGPTRLVWVTPAPEIFLKKQVLITDKNWPLRHILLRYVIWK